MKLTDLFPGDDLWTAIEAGHVTRKTHPTLPLSILTYSPVCQYDNIWTPVTMACRGLVVDDSAGEIVAFPFPKIFVTDMHERGFDFAPPLPAEPFEIFEKLDGSLIITFHYDGRWHTASKGSFISEQAQWAQGRIDESDTSRLDPSITYLAEAIYPGNRIVVDYGAREELVLLATYRPADGTDVPLSASTIAQWGTIGRPAMWWKAEDDISVLVQQAAANQTMRGAEVSGQDEEGYVIRFASGRRAKIKLTSYLVLHKLFTGTNERTIWEVLASGQDPSVLFDTAPDEFADWARSVADTLRQRHSALVDEAVDAYADVMSVLPDDPDRKTFALEAVKSPHKSALFMILDGNDDKVSSWAWKQIKPRGDVPFKNDEDN